MTNAMQRTIEETGRRRKLQEGVQPSTASHSERSRKAIHAGSNPKLPPCRGHAKVGPHRRSAVHPRVSAELEAEIVWAADAMEFGGGHLRDAYRADAKIRSATGPMPCESRSHRGAKPAREEEDGRSGGEGRVPRRKEACEPLTSHVVV